MNDEAKNMAWLQKVIRAGNVHKAFRLLSVQAENSFLGQFFVHRHSTYGLRKYQRLLHGVFCGKVMRGHFWKCWVNCGDIYFMTRILNNPSKILNSASWSVFVTSIKPLPTTNITHFISECFIKTSEYRTITCESQLTLAKLQWVSV